MTTYDQLWTSFLTSAQTDDINLPNTPDKIYESIHNGVRLFNNRLRDILNYDDTTEVLDRELNGDELLILSHFLRLAFLENQLIYFTTVWQPFQKDIGLKNYSFQLKSLENVVQKEKDTIDQLIMNTAIDYL